jgi:hypothetical protein
LTDHSQRSTAHLIEPQTFFSLVSGEKTDNQANNYLQNNKKTVWILFKPFFYAHPNYAFQQIQVRLTIKQNVLWTVDRLTVD